MGLIKYKGREYKTGDSVIFTIKDVIVRGKLYLEPKRHSSQNTINAFVCHNSKKFNGSHSPNKLGYQYSWTFSFDETYPFKDSDVNIICPDINDARKEKVFISKKLKLYFESQDLELISQLFKIGPIFKQYNKIEISEKTGYLKLTDKIKDRSVDIKFGRFLTTFIKEVKDSYGIELGIVNKDVEKFYNFFVAYQTNTHTEILELKGDEILEGYKIENYLFEKSSLGGSCMNNKLENLKLYTVNPEMVSLLVIKTFGKIAGRCFIWNTNEGKVMDKRYTCADWVNSKFETILKKNKYICYSSLEDKEIDIQLDNTDLDKYPYLDTFKYLNKEKGFITNSIKTIEENKEFLELSRTDGLHYYFDENGVQTLCN